MKDSFYNYLYIWEEDSFLNSTKFFNRGVNHILKSFLLEVFKLKEADDNKNIDFYNKKFELIGTALKNLHLLDLIDDLRENFPDSENSLNKLETSYSEFKKAIINVMKEIQSGTKQNNSVSITPETILNSAESLSSNLPTIQSGRNYVNIFISDVYDDLVSKKQYSGTLDNFKTELVKLNTSGKIKLKRADLVAAMDPNKVMRSETKYLEARYHFIEVDK